MPFATSLNALLSPLISLKNAGKALVGIIRAIGVAIISNPLGIMLAGIAGVGLLVYKYWDRVKAFFSGFFSGIKAGLAPLINSLKGIWQIISGAFAPLMPIFNAVGEFFASLFSQSEASKESLAGFKNIGEMVGKAIGAVINLVATPLRWLIDTIKWIFDFIAGSSVGAWLGDKMGISISEADKAELKGMSAPQLNTSGAVDSVISSQDATTKINASNSKNTINDNKKIDIHLHGTQATPQGVALAVSENGYGFED
ncbi:hypothetical protein KDD93_01925 [Campylobacter sp. faydin G-24]|uniref:Phage tail tape measure protein n=1 Tax=Campylobacter anatolicus TaxID=2829105 RepID=A0ABS5HGC9_9BACT|nr:hypothetical protein [Campylobacter anatolicus]MBR8463329.1 hypothetical protein [Campylobacter anatolicus]